MAAKVQMKAITAIQRSNAYGREVISKGAIFFASPEEAAELVRLGGASVMENAPTSGEIPGKIEPVAEPESEPAEVQTFEDDEPESEPEPAPEPKPEPKPEPEPKPRRGRKSSADDLV